MRQTLLLTLLLAMSINGSMGLPRNNNKHQHHDNQSNHKQHGSSNSNNRHHRNNNNNVLGGQHRSSLVTLNDEFPCDESAATPSSSSSVETGENGHLTNTHQSSTSSSPGVTFTGNSFAEMNNIQIIDNSNSSSTPSSPVSLETKSTLTTRGGADADTIMDDDEIDLMVESLIAGLENVENVEQQVDNNDEESEEEEEEEEEVDESEGSDEESQLTSVEGDDDEVSEDEEESDQEPIAINADNASADDSINAPEPNSVNTVPSSPVQRSRHSDGPPILPLATPTNAYYRFLVRRGPKGHILASFTLISIQWIQVYVPLLYKSAAAILLKLHIYDPKVLWKRDKLKREEEERRRRGIYPERKGMMGVFSNKKSSAQKKERSAQQTRADLQASQTLKQLYKAIKSGEGGGGALSEVKYRYLSAAFRRKHGLGREYRVEKPMSFLGEVLEGDAHQRVLGAEEAVLDEVVFSDGEGDDVDVESAGDDSVGKLESKQQQKRKRKKVNDWVVQAFGNRKPRPKSSQANDETQQHFEPLLWKAVDSSAIMQAAWESRAAEQLAWQKKRRSKQHGNGDFGEDSESEEGGGEEAIGKSSGYGASKMFQSVMTRVGSNGRLPGAYPMDAPPIEECASNRGVLEFARRYGYGDWRGSSIDYDDETSEDEGESFGGGDLFSVKPASEGRKVRRKKKQRSIPVIDAADNAIGKRRKRRKKSSSVKLGMSGGGVSWDSNRVSFEFGISSSAGRSRRQRDAPAFSSPASSRRMEANDIKSKLSERSNLFTSDTRVKAPTELLNKSRDRLRKKRDGDNDL